MHLNTTEVEIAKAESATPTRLMISITKITAKTLQAITATATIKKTKNSHSIKEQSQATMTPYERE